FRAETSITAAAGCSIVAHAAMAWSARTANASPFARPRRPALPESADILVTDAVAPCTAPIVGKTNIAVDPARRTYAARPMGVALPRARRRASTAALSTTAVARGSTVARAREAARCAKTAL